MEKKICREDIANENEIPLINDLECSIDMSISLNPLICRKCENIFCQDCAEKWKQKSNTCPMRCEPFEVKKVENTLYGAQLKKIRLFCGFADKGCKETPLHFEKEKHEKDCNYRPIRCPKCNIYGIPKFSLEEHMLTKCERLKIKCFICNNLKSLGEFMKHFEDCYNISFRCEYCFSRINSLNEAEINKHNENCVMKVQNCKKCKFPDFKKNLEKMHIHDKDVDDMEMQSKNFFYFLKFFNFFISNFHVQFL